MAAGGIDNNYVGFLDLNTLTWEPKAGMPKEIYLGASVPYQDSFLIVGGYNKFSQDDYLSSIYYYDPINDEWDRLMERLTYKRREFAAFLIPDSYANCS